MAASKSQELAYGDLIPSGGSDAILSNYFKEILMRLGLEIGRFQGMLDRYIKRRNPTINSVNLSSDRSALYRELMATTMTWKVFIKGLMFLNVRSLTMTLTLYRERGNKISTHEHSFYLKEDIEDKGVLSTLFAQILNDLRIGPDEFERHLNNYVKKSKPGSNTNDRYIAKSSISREILSENISWKVFIKALIFLSTNKMTLSLQLFHNNNLVTLHNKTMVFK